MNATFVWLIILVVLIVIEIITMGLTTIWFAGGALVAAAAAAVGCNIYIQTLLFAAVSLVLLYFTRPLAVKYFNKDRAKTNVESMVGKQAIVTSEIDNLQGIGQVTVGGMEWSARAAREKQVIEVGAVVTVKQVEGVKLIVE